MPCEMCGRSDDVGYRVCHACLSALAGTPASAVPRVVWVVWSEQVSELRSVLKPFPKVPAERRAACAAALPALISKAAAQPDDVRPALKLAETAALAGDVEVARAAFATACDLYLQADYPLKALTVARTHLSLEPELAAAHLRAARVQFKLGYLALAVREAFAAVRLGWPEVSTEAIDIIVGSLTEEQCVRLRGVLAEHSVR